MYLIDDFRCHGDVIGREALNILVLLESPGKRLFRKRKSI
jgi:hypothetical protein